MQYFAPSCVREYLECANTHYHYFSSSSSGLLLTLAKLSGQILLTMAFYAFVLDQQISNDWVEFLLLSIPTFSIVGLHNIKDFYVNYWRADKDENSGYKLEIKFLPTAANTEVESWRFSSNPDKEAQRCCKWRVKQNWYWFEVNFGCCLSRMNLDCSWVWNL